MGVGIKITDQNFTIRHADFGRALELLEAMPAKRYSWGCDPHGHKDVQDALYEFGYGTDVNAEGDIVLVYSHHDKMGDEELIFRALAPVVVDGSYLQFQGDESVWRWAFRGGEMRELKPKWDEA